MNYSGRGDWEPVVIERAPRSAQLWYSVPDSVMKKSYSDAPRASALEQDGEFAWGTRSCIGADANRERRRGLVGCLAKAWSGCDVWRYSTKMANAWLSMFLSESHPKRLVVRWLGSLKLLLVLSVACSGSVTLSDEPKDVSIVELIATPERFRNQLVRLVGYASVEFEGRAVYLHREDYSQAITRNGLWLDLPEREYPGFERPRYAIVEGRFDPTGHGHLNLFSGTIASVNRLVAWPGRE
jgi:hypothetical protein